MRFSQLQTRTKILGAFAVGLARHRPHLRRRPVAHAGRRCPRRATWSTTSWRASSSSSELLGVARLNGMRAVAIARSDSLEAGDYFQAQLAQGDQDAAALEARLQALAASPDERAAGDAGGAAQGRLPAGAPAGVPGQGPRQDPGGRAARRPTRWPPPSRPGRGALEALLARQTRQARALAAASANASLFSRVLLLAFGGAALLLGAASGWLLTRSIVAPLQEPSRLAERVARGDLSATIRARPRRRDRAPVRRPEPHDRRRLRHRGEGARQRAPDRRCLGRHRRRQPRPVAAAPSTRPAACTPPSRRWSS